FRHRQIGKSGIEVPAIPASRPDFGGFNQIAPVVRASTGAVEELIDALLCGFGVLRHVSLPILRRGAGSSDRAPRPIHSIDPSQGSGLSQSKLTRERSMPPF